MNSCIRIKRIPYNLGAVVAAFILVALNIQAASHYQVLKSFSSATTDCFGPAGGVSIASDGLIYGASVSGGISNAGALFRLNTNGAGYNLLRNFTFAPGDTPSPNKEPVEGAD